MAAVSNFFVDPRPQFFDANGNPLSFGTLDFFQAGTDVRQNIYEDSTLTTSLSNPLTLDPDGRIPETGLWLIDAHYRLVVKDSVGNTISNVPDFIGAGGLGGSAGTIGVVESIANLKALVSGSYSLVFVQGYYSAQDGGGGWFYWLSDSVADENSGTVFIPNSAPLSGRWFRNMEGGLPIKPIVFGGSGDGLRVVVSNFLAMIDFMDANRDSNYMVIPGGTYLLNADLVFPDWFVCDIEDNAKFQSKSGAHTVTFENEPNIKSKSTLFDPSFDGMNGLFDGRIAYTDPVWWGVKYGHSDGDQSLPLTRAGSGSGSNALRPSGEILLSSSATITSALDVSHPDCKFTVSGILSIDSDIVGSPEYQVFFPSSEDQITITKPQQIKAAWFGLKNDDATDNTTALEYCRDAIYLNGGEILYPASGVCRIDGTYTDSHGGDAGRIRHNIPIGGLVRIGDSADVLLDAIASQRWKCFAVTAGGALAIRRGFIYSEWFGALGDDTVDDGAALIDALTVTWRSGGTLECSGAIYRIESPASWSAPLVGASRSFRVQNMNMNYFSGPTSSYGFTFGSPRGNVSVLGCSFRANYPGNPVASFSGPYCLVGCISDGRLKTDNSTLVVGSIIKTLMAGAAVNTVVGNIIENMGGNDSAMNRVSIVGNSWAQTSGSFRGTVPGRLEMIGNVGSETPWNENPGTPYTPDNSGVVRTGIHQYRDGGSFAGGSYQFNLVTSCQGVPPGAKIKWCAISYRQFSDSSGTGYQTPAQCKIMNSGMPFGEEGQWVEVIVDGTYQIDFEVY